MLRLKSQPKKGSRPKSAPLGGTFILLEISVEQTFQTAAVASLVACHFVDGVVDGIQAILCGAADDTAAKRIAAALTRPGNGLTPVTLSMKGFVYDALLHTDQKQYAPYVLENIRSVYLKMLNEGATSVWETELGAHDFGGAGSLCHGWSALPIYYLHKLLP